MSNFDVATIQTATNAYEERVIVAPRTEDGTVLLDSCPRGTIEVRSYPTAKAAANRMGVHVRTVYAQLAKFRSEA